ncbi:hypothetical protein [Parasulfitobacter algicola]|uniref:Uncharacterized protein n=1 Tax=Parasulfitobacter algicola TaxID=2614809 RepID=A0ABX2IQA6_9RHOB|nr:hypothetical protein [Sulfitobacter algicola]NSX53290.1 hypothetical protein [Sulfitobacter algicola]
MNQPIRSSSAAVRPQVVMPTARSASSGNNVQVEQTNSNETAQQNRSVRPVRVLIAGEAGSGKSELVKFLVGENPVPEDLKIGDMPPVILRFGETHRTSAGWWGGERKQFSGIDIAAAVQEKPDYIALHVPNPFLKRINLFDLSGTHDPARLQEQFVRVAQHSEIVLWCTDSAKGWSEAESNLWSRIPARMADASMLVVTHSGQEQDKISLSRSLHRLKTKAAPLFHSMIPLATNRAIDAAPGGQVANMDVWTESGGKSLISGILFLAKSVRQAEKKEGAALKANAAALRKAFANPDTPRGGRPAARPTSGFGGVNAQPFGSARPQAAEAAPQVAPLIVLDEIPDIDLEEILDKAPAVVEPSQKSSENQLLSYLYAQTDQLVDLVGTDDEFDEPEFLSICTQTLDEFSYRLSQATLRDDAVWVEEQVQEAAELLILLQLEGGDQSLLDAAAIVLQLGRDVSWAVAA